MEWSKIVLDNLAHFISLALLAFMGYIFKTTLLDPLATNQAALNKHIDECNRIPKILLLEKLENLSEKQDQYSEEAKDRSATINKRLDVLGDRYHNIIAPAIGKLSADIEGLKHGR